MPAKNPNAPAADELAAHLKDWGACKGASAKLAFIQSWVPHVAKTGRNDHQKFDYMQEHGILALLRPFQRLLHVALIVGVVPDSVHQDGTMTQAVFRVRLVDCDEPQDSTDRVVEDFIVMQATDKVGWGAAKLLTYGKKFALQKFCGIPTEELPEAEAEAIEQVPAAPATKRISKPQLVALTNALKTMSEHNPDLPQRVAMKLQSLGASHLSELEASKVKQMQAWVEEQA